MSLGRTAVKSRFLLALGAAALAAAFFVHEFLLLAAAGAGSAGAMAIENALRRVRGAAPAEPPVGRSGGAPPFSPSKKSSSSLSFFPLFFSSAALSSSFSLSSLFLFFLKTGAILFGSGYVLLAFLRADLVERWHWLTSAQLLDGVNVASLALMAAVTLQLARPALVNVPTAALFLASTAVLATLRINAAWLVLAGGLLGIAFG